MTLSMRMGGVRLSMKSFKTLTLIKPSAILRCYIIKRRLVVNGSSRESTIPMALSKETRQG